MFERTCLTCIYGRNRQVHVNVGMFHIRFSSFIYFWMDIWRGGISIWWKFMIKYNFWVFIEIFLLLKRIMRKELVKITSFLWTFNCSLIFSSGRCSHKNMNEKLLHILIINSKIHILNPHPSISYKLILRVWLTWCLYILSSWKCFYFFEFRNCFETPS